MTFIVENSKRVEGRRLAEHHTFLETKVKTTLSKTVAVIRGTASTAIDSCPPFPLFFYLPIEIRLEIFWWALLAHAEIYAGVDKFRPIGKYRLAPGERPDPIRLITSSPGSAYWGSESWCMIFPVCRQWYQEIQITFYSRFDFDIFLTSHIERSQRPYLAFLPPHVIPLIRHVNILIGPYWDELLDMDSTEELFRQCDQVAASLTGLTRARVVFGGRCQAYIHPRLREEFIGVVVRICRPFAAMYSTEIDGTYWGRDESCQGIPLELLLPECRTMLRGELSKHVIDRGGASDLPTAVSYEQDNV